MIITAKNLNQLKKELKPLEGRAILKITRTDSLKNGTFNRVLHKVRQKDLVLFTGKELSYLEFGKASDIEFLPNSFKIRNCTIQLDKIMSVNEIYLLLNNH
jgi:hypothetical protein